MKDSDFSLGNAYSFAAKVGIVRPDHAVIFATTKVGGDAKEHFERACLARDRRSEYYMPSDDPQIHYIEGLSSLRAGVAALATSIYKKDAIHFMQRVLSLAALRADQLVPTLEAASSDAAAQM